MNGINNFARRGEPIHVAVAAVNDVEGRILISRRADHLHQGGLWEFPGGKVEASEDVEQALQRELYEELGISVTRSEPLIRILHHYTDRSVILDVHKVSGFSGKPHSREGQPWRWVLPDKLTSYAFPAADRPIIQALILPEQYLITGENPNRSEQFLARLDYALNSGVKLIQLRAKSLSDYAYARLAQRALERCHSYGARLVLNGPLEVCLNLAADGIHLTSAQLCKLKQRPLQRDKLVAASCHNRSQLVLAEKLGIDFAVLSPVMATTSHPDAVPLGWGQFTTLVDEISIPVYALGGMRPNDVPQSKRAGAQGIAAIRGLWPDIA